MPELQQFDRIFRSWGVVKQGIYFMSRADKPEQMVRFFSFSTRRVYPLLTFDREPIWNYPDVAVSEDGRVLLTARLDQEVTISCWSRTFDSENVMSGTTGEVTQLLNAWCPGDAEAFERLARLLEAELRHVARIYLSRETTGHTLHPTALVHEAYIRLINWDVEQWQNRAHFFSFVIQCN